MQFKGRKETKEQERARDQAVVKRGRVGELGKPGAKQVCCGVGGFRLSALTMPSLAPMRLCCTNHTECGLLHKVRLARVLAGRLIQHPVAQCDCAERQCT